MQQDRKSGAGPVRGEVMRYQMTVAVILGGMYVGGLVALRIAHETLVMPHGTAGRAIVVALLVVLTALEVFASAIVVFGLHRLMVRRQRPEARPS